MLAKTQISLVDKINAIESLIGNTQTQRLVRETSIYAKLEHTNFSGSIKDRAALNILKNGILSGSINEDSIIIESTSGNFGISLAYMCISMNIKYIAVVDPNISESNKKKLTFLAHKVVEITERDETGGYLLSRLKYVEEFKRNNKNVFHPDQYNNSDNYKGYYQMVDEISQQFDHLDYIVIAVSTGGTITGLSQNIKLHFPNVEVVAVDVCGSQIFSNNVKKRTLSGIGASKKSYFIERFADIDHALIFSEDEIIEGCRKLNRENGIFAGISSGAAYCGAMEMKRLSELSDPQILIICPDGLTAYIELFN